MPYNLVTLCIKINLKIISPAVPEIRSSKGHLNFFVFLNQARASERPACAWFLEIAFVCKVGMCVCVCVCVRVCVRPEAINYIDVILTCTTS